MQGESPKLIGVTIGNTRTRIGVMRGATVEDVRAVNTADADAIAAEVGALAAPADDGEEAGGIVLAGVHLEAARALEPRLGELGIRVYRVGRDLEIPLRHALDDASTLGQDRALCALGAYAKWQEACVVVDAGTAITVDFVDGTGVFQGGAIAPGLAMMLGGMHERTAALPALRPERPEVERGPFGKDTAHAMQLGVRGAAVGLVQYLLETYSEAFGSYPRVVATGGDAALLFDGNPLIERIVPELQLIGLAEACRVALGEDEEDWSGRDGSEGGEHDGGDEQEMDE